MSNSLILDDFHPIARDTLDSTMISDFQRCPQMFYLKHILGLQTKNEKVHLTFGTLWHKVLEVFFASEDGPLLAVELIEENFGTFSPLDKKNRTPERMKVDLLAYLIKWEDVDRAYRPLATEQGFDLYLPNGTRYCGKIDKVAFNGDTKRVTVVDYKSATMMTRHYFDHHKMGVQIRGYVWATGELMPGEKVLTAMMDIYHILANETKFHRKTFTFDKSQISEWLANVINITDQIHHLQETALHDPGMWVLDGARCTDWGGCEFLPIHTMPNTRGMRERLLGADFKIERWDPLAEFSDDKVLSKDNPLIKEA